MIEAFILGLGYGYIHSALCWVVKKIERLSLAINPDELSAELRSGYNWLQAKVPVYLELADKYADKAYKQDGGTSLMELGHLFTDLINTVYVDIRKTIIVISEFEKAIENLKG